MQTHIKVLSTVANYYISYGKTQLASIMFVHMSLAICEQIYLRFWWYTRCLSVTYHIVYQRFANSTLHILHTVPLKITRLSFKQLLNVCSFHFMVHGLHIHFSRRWRKWFISLYDKEYSNNYLNSSTKKSPKYMIPTTHLFASYKLLYNFSNNNFFNWMFFGE